jgi:hypothetical protein
MVIILVVIGGYFINGYWWLFMTIILMAIGEYFVVDIRGY